MRWKVLFVVALAVGFGAGVLVGRITAPSGASAQPTTGLLNVWLVGPPGQSVMFCPHPELMIGGPRCEPLSRVAAYIPRVLPPEPTKVAPGCTSVNRLIFNFADRSRAVYGICQMPSELMPLYTAAWKVMNSSPPLTR